MKRFGLFILGVLLTCLSLEASIGDTIIAIKEVRTKGVRFDAYSTGARILTLDTNIIIDYQTTNIAELLAQNSLVSVRTYGPSGLSNISMRGGSTRHTAVIWNGFNLKSPMTGSMNYSSMPTGFIDNISIQSGGSSTMYGSGASTGVIFLNNSLYTGSRKTIGSVNTEVASYGTFSTSTAIAQILPRFSTRLKFGYIVSENNYKYVAQAFGKPIKRIEHAAYKRYGISQQNTVKLGEKTKLETDFWYTYLFKEVPSLTSDATPGTAEQDDKNIRAAVVLSHYHDDFTIKYRTGAFYDEINYYDPEPLLVESANQSFSMMNEFEARYKTHRLFNLNLGANHSYEHGRSSGYIADTGRSRVSVYGRANLRLIDRIWDISMEGRKEFMQKENVPFVFSVGTSYKLLEWVWLKGNVSKHYSLPILDDLFWAEDAFARGNPNLISEYGWNYEGGFKVAIDKKQFSFGYEQTLYQNRIHDLIIWLPGNDGKWSPTNINNSITNGIESSIDVNRLFSNDQEAGLRFLLAYTDAKMYQEDDMPKTIQRFLRFLLAYTDAKIFQEDDKAEATQRLYVPKWKTNFSFYYKYKRLKATYIQSVESRRYFNDIGTLDPYLLADIFINYALPIEKVNIKTFLKIKNIFNVNYQYVNGYAQPLRNYAIGINLTF